MLSINLASSATSLANLFTLPISPAGYVLSINGNTGFAGDTGFAKSMERAL